MAGSNFQVWYDDPEHASPTWDGLYDAESFEDDAHRANGFRSGNVLSSTLLNSVLRQNSLVVAGLMHQFCNTDTVSLRSNLADIMTALSNGIASTESVNTVAASVIAIENAITRGTLEAGNAAKLDNKSPSYYLDYNNFSNKPSIPTASSSMPAKITKTGSVGSSTSFARADHTHPSMNFADIANVTISTSAPSGGNNGDIWIQVL